MAVAEALGRNHVRVALDEHHTEQVIRGKEGAAPGRIVRGLREAGVRNPAFIIELLDEVKPEVAGALLDVLDPVVGSAFQDQYLQLRFDLSAALWIMTAADPKAIPKQMRGRLEVIELPGYTEQEKLTIAEQYLLERPFEVRVPVPAGCLAPEPAVSPASVAPDTGLAGPVVVAERELSSMAELEALSAGPPFPAADAWRTAASEGASPLPEARHDPRHLTKCTHSAASCARHVAEPHSLSAETPGKNSVRECSLGAPGQSLIPASGPALRRPGTGRVPQCRASYN